MALSSGTRIGSYEIVAPLGVGGMGEVYRARDRQLRREVAIKVLPDAVSHDTDRLARFQREAEILAALNHPNIAAIYGLERSDAGIAIVLELVEGETLADVIARGPVPISDALPIARAIADALEAAHDKGIVHRDLKPANVKISSEGKVKVLDFGLAKAVDSPPQAGPPTPGQLTASPTLSLHATYAGVILGTAAYMSPEQARGKIVDRRTDIWAFGCVLYEMLTGKQAFEAGETVSDAIAAILKHEPDWSTLPADTPTHIRTLLKRCLHKDPQKRLPHIGVARLEIDEGADRVELATTSVAPPRPRWLSLASVAALTAVLAFGAAVWMFRAPNPARVVSRFAFPLPVGQRFTDRFLPMLAISPSGAQMAYVANEHLFVRSMSELTAQSIAAADGGDAGNIGALVFSPDSESIVYWTRAAERSSDLGTLKRVRLQGGAPQTIAQVRRPLGVSWTGNDILIGQPPPDGILRVPANGGTPQRIVSAKSDQLLQGPQLLPGGNAVLFTIATNTATSTGLTSDDTWAHAQVVVQDLQSGERRTLVDGGTDARYLPTGHLVYGVGGILMARAFDVRGRTFTGPAISVIEGVSPTRLGQFAAGSLQMSVSDNGSLIYVPGPAMVTAVDQRDLVIADRSGIQALKLPAGLYEHPRVSPNGKQIAFDTDDGKNAIVWISDLSGTTSPRQLTFEGKNRFPVWSHDGQRVFFQSERDGEAAIYWQSADGAAPAERLISSEGGPYPVPGSATSDGKFLLFQKGDAPSISENRPELRSIATLWMFSIVDKKTSAFATQKSVTGIAPIGPTISSDGRWVAYSIGSDTTRASLQLYVQSLSSGARYLIATGAVDQMWSPASKEFFFNSLVAGGAFSTTITTQPRFEFSNPMPLPMALSNVFRRARVGPGSPRNIDVMPDGQHFVAAVRHEASNLSGEEIVFVSNWFDELKARVPTR